MNIYRWLAICAMISPILYTCMWIIGGIVVPGYSHIQNDVSSLFAVGAHSRWLFQSMAMACALLLLLFYSGFHWTVTGGEGSIVGPLLFFVAAFLGVLVALFFPLDVGGEPTTWRGKGHLALIALSGVVMIAAMVFVFFRLKGVDGWHGFGMFHIISAPVLLVGVIIMIPFTGSPYMGLVERFMVSAYQVFYFVSGVWIFIANGKT